MTYTGALRLLALTNHRFPLRAAERTILDISPQLLNMGSVLSRVKLIIGALFFKNTLNVLSKRLKKSPGVPVSNPSQPFWTVPKAKISGSKKLPQHADIVIVGSGITGTSFAYNILKVQPSLNIVMLEARDVCSGATGRNGGHINPPLFHDYRDLKERYGGPLAKKMIRFRLAHLQDILAISKAEAILDVSQCREIVHIDVHTDLETYEEAKQLLEVWKTDMPSEAADFQAIDGFEALQVSSHGASLTFDSPHGPKHLINFGLSSRTVGCISGGGGAVHPYRFVTSLLSKLLERHSDNFVLATHTPCTSVATPGPTTPYYTVSTPKGVLTTSHVIHATNGWCSHLLEPMREKILPARGTMSAQRPGTALSKSSLDGDRSFVFYTGKFGYDYLTQLPTGEKELMYGGGWASGLDIALSTDIGLADDSDFNVTIASHLAGSLPLHFGPDNWGEEAPYVPQDEDDEVQWERGRTKAQWGGILGLSADGKPWVGRLPSKVSGRCEPPHTSTPIMNSKDLTEGNPTSPRALTAVPGEWIAAGYTGEGMVHAWMCGKALAHMVLGDEDSIKDWFPEEILRVTEKRWRKADVVEFLSRYL